VRRSWDALAHASQEMAHGNHDVSDRTALQASALEQTAASMEQLGATARRNTDNAQEGNRLANDASAVADKGRDAVRQVEQTMQGIDESSRKIAETIRVIDAIAFQTNILALNAAVESARAGAQGRGFAIVAAEVRTLAARSAQAAREINALIQTSVERVRNGSALVGEAGTTMLEVVQAIRRVADIMGEISTASGEQMNGVSQVGAAVTHLDQATQQNATLVQEIAAAAHGLKAQAAGLVETVAVFKVDADAQPAA
jgi:methyl-accepting chemotaxis protein